MLHKLEPFLPNGALPIVSDLLEDENYHLVITKPRRTKLGDFRPPRNSNTPKLTVNGNLNQYSFLITLIHEIAHLKIWHLHKNKVKPHGKEWKNLYADLLSLFLDQNIFPKDVYEVVRNHIQKPKYSSSSDSELTLALKRYDEGYDELLLLRDLIPGNRFVLHNRVFEMEKKLRTRYLCTDLKNGKKYRIHELAQIEPFHSKELT